MPEHERRTEGERDGAAPAFELAVSPFCTQLQSKKLYFLGRPPMTERDVLDASQHCWCRCTMQILGPDGEVAHPDECRSHRTCFRGLP